MGLNFKLVILCIIILIFKLQYSSAQDEPEDPDAGTTKKPPAAGGGRTRDKLPENLIIYLATLEKDAENPDITGQIFQSIDENDILGLLHKMSYHVDIWFTLIERFRFNISFVFPDRRKDSLEYLKTMVSEGKADGTLVALPMTNETISKTVYLPPVDVGKYKLFVKTPTSEAAWSSLGNVFRPPLWIATALAIFFMALSLIAIEHLGYRAKIPKYLEAPADTGQLFMIILGNFCYQGGLNIASGMSGRVVSLTGLITGYLVYISYSTLVISQLTAVKVVPPFESLQEMARKPGYKLYVSNDKSLLEDIETVRRNKSNALADTWDKVLPAVLTPNDVFNEEVRGLTKLCASDSAILALDNKIIGKLQAKAKCSATPLKPTYFKTYMGFVFNKNFKYKDVLQRAINEIRELGILHRLREAWNVYDQINLPREKSAAKVKPIALGTILPVIAIVAVGLVLGVIVLTGELSYKKVDSYYNNRIRENQIKMFHRKRKFSTIT